jgi:hypothetical protein
VAQCLGVGKQYSAVGSVPSLYQGRTNVNLWPPFSVTVTPMQATAPCSTHGLVSTGSSFMLFMKFWKQNVYKDNH